MTEAILHIKHWGNNLGVRLPGALVREANFHDDQRVRVSVEAGQVIISPMADAPLTLEQSLTRFDPLRHGGETMVSMPRGAERW